MRHCSRSSDKRGSPIRSPHRMTSSAANYARQDQTFVPIATSRIASPDHYAASEAGDIGGSLRTRISIRSRFGHKGVTRWGKGLTRGDCRPSGSFDRATRRARRIGAGRTNERGMQRNQEVEVSNRSVDDNVIVIGGGARVSSVPERSPAVDSGSPSSSESSSAVSARLGPVSRQRRCFVRERQSIVPVERQRMRESILRRRLRCVTSWSPTTSTLGWSAGWRTGASACCAVAADAPVLVSSRWMECATPPLTCCRDRRGSIRAARVPLEVLSDTIQPFPCFSVDLPRNTETTPLCRQLVYRAAGWLRRPNDIRPECELGAASRR
jgi:hypothetical protein